MYKGTSFNHPSVMCTHLAHRALNSTCREEFQETFGGWKTGAMWIRTASSFTSLGGEEEGERRPGWPATQVYGTNLQLAQRCGGDAAWRDDGGIEIKNK
jgi:hypothetical protein